MSTAGGPTAGVVLAGACWPWAAGTEDMGNFRLLPFWVPIAPTVLTVGGTHRPRVWCGGRPIIGS